MQEVCSKSSVDAREEKKVKKKKEQARERIGWRCVSVIEGTKSGRLITGARQLRVLLSLCVCICASVCD